MAITNVRVLRTTMTHATMVAQQLENMLDEIQHAEVMEEEIDNSNDHRAFEKLVEAVKSLARHELIG